MYTFAQCELYYAAAEIKEVTEIRKEAELKGQHPKVVC
jgi:hypothetical protein